MRYSAPLPLVAFYTHTAGEAVSARMQNNAETQRTEGRRTPKLQGSHRSREVDLIGLTTAH